MSENINKIDHLKEDPEILNQKWVCLSFLTPETVKMKTDVRSVKVRGVYNSEDEAKKRCEEIRQFDIDFNVYIAPVGKWLAWCDDPDKATDFNYANKKLNNMMKSYYENQQKANDEFNQRKEKMIENNAEENKKIIEENKKLAEGNTEPELINEIIDETVDEELENAEKLYQELLNN